ncbi:MAG: sulfite exporter TauE/SafE family protein [Hyphomicrobiales bacterium]|nr:sulfite exporter TauE/SafE family protein [Hyphomicrobiales bacterium]
MAKRWLVAGSFLTDPWFYAVALPAVTLFGLSKGGLGGIGLLSMPLMSLVVPPITAASIILPVLMVQDVVTVWSWWRRWDRQLIAHLLPGALAGVLIGWLTAKLVSDVHVRLMVGVISVAFGLNWMFGRGEARPARPHDHLAGGLLGLIGGYTSFVIHVGGPPMNMYALPRKPDRDGFVGAYAIMFAIINFVKLPAYVGLGQMTVETLTLSAVLLPVAIAANLAGVWLVRRLPTALFFRFVYAMTLVIGLKLVFDAVRELAR